jgi:adenosine deaminase
MPKEKKPQGSLEDMLTCFEFFLPLVYDNVDLLEELAFDFVQRQWEQNVIYTEVRYSPNLLSKDPTNSLAAITKGLRRGCERFPVIVNQILCAICFFPDWAKNVVELAHQHRSDFPCAVVGVDIAAGEAHFERDSPFWKGHYDMCQQAQALNLNITIHAGETPSSADHVRWAIEEYGARRIGHAYRIADRSDIMKIVRDKKVHIESCPTSSVETGGWQKTHWKNHPAVAFREYGISLSLSSDDPAVFNTSLTWQYRIALKQMGFQKQDIFDTLEQAIEASFLDEASRDDLREKVAKWKIHDNYAFDDRVHFD